MSVVRPGAPGRQAGVQARRVSRTFKLTIAYDGTDFIGWQRQAAGVSIQGLLEDALSELDGRPVAVTGAGRTDAGVHARGQVARAAGGRVVGAASIVDRGGSGALDVPFRSLVSIDLPTYEPEQCPLCARGLPVVKPGSRPVA